MKDLSNISCDSLSHVIYMCLCDFLPMYEILENADMSEDGFINELTNNLSWYLEK